MGYHEAIEDGIEIRANGTYTFYTVKCEKCGEKIKTLKYSRDTKYICSDCKDKDKAKAKYAKAEYRNQKKQRQFKAAVGIIKKQIKYERQKQEDYTNAIDEVKKKIDNGCEFDSKEEMLAAILLEKSNINYLPQAKIGTYKVDFAIPDYKIILEIDGVCYHNYSNYYKDREREKEILLRLGPSWKIVRLTDNEIDYNILYLDELLFEARSDKYLFKEDTNYDSEYSDIAFSHSMERYANSSKNYLHR